MEPAQRLDASLVRGVGKEVELSRECRLEVGHPHADEPHGRSRVPDLAEQTLGHGSEHGLVVGWLLEPPLRAPRGLEVRLDAHGDRDPAEPLSPEPPAHHGAHGVEGGAHLGLLAEVLGKRSLVGDRLRGALGGADAYGGALDAGGSGLEDGSHLPECARELGLVGAAKLTQGLDAQPQEPRLGCGAHAAHGPNGQGGQKARLGPRHHHGDASRLLGLGGNLCHGLAYPEADRAGDAEPRDAALDAPADVDGALAREAAGRDVKERLVDGDLLHARRLVCEYVHDLRAQLPVAVEVSMGPDGVRAQALSLGGGHGGSDPIAPCLVGRRRDDAPAVGVAAHDYGLAAPLGVVELLDAREERVKVEQADRWALPRGLAPGPRGPSKPAGHLRTCP